VTALEAVQRAGLPHEDIECERRLQVEQLALMNARDQYARIRAMNEIERLRAARSSAAREAIARARGSCA